MGPKDSYGNKEKFKLFKTSRRIFYWISPTEMWADDLKEDSFGQIKTYKPNGDVGLLRRTGLLRPAKGCPPPKDAKRQGRTEVE